MYVMTVSLNCFSVPKERLESISREQWENVLEEVSPITDSRLPDFDTLTGGAGYWSFEGVVTIAAAKVLSDALGELVVRRVRGLFSEHSPRDILRDAALSGKAATTIQITVPGGVALTSLTSLTYLEDACTDHVQQCLNEGWRIVAVCPPNDSRRPTYILGHTEPGRRVP